MTKTDEALELTITGKPQPKGRPRFSRSGKAYTPTVTRQWEGYLRMCFQLAIKTPLEGDIWVDLVYFTTSRADVDNLTKAFLDAGNKILFNDDSQVKKLSAEKIKSKEECTQMTVRRITNDRCRKEKDASEC